MEPSRRQASDFEEAYFTSSTYARYRDADEAKRIRSWYRGLNRYLGKRAPQLERVDRTLELGCGYGGALYHLPVDHRTTVSIDISNTALQIARVNQPFVRFIRADASMLPVREKAHELVLAFELMEHFREPEKMIREVYRCLTPGGLFIGTTPNPRADLLPAFSAWSDRTHVTVMPPWRWSEMFEAEGFHSVRVETVLTVPLLWRLSSWLSFTFRVPVIGPTTIIRAIRPTH